VERKATGANWRLEQADWHTVIETHLAVCIGNEAMPIQLQIVV
jgi:hypothetical protein